MSWNGNDLFNSTLMGGMPSGADPHQYLTTDGNGKPHWEDKLAYEESAVVEIMPTTNVGTIWYSQKTVACPHNGAVKVGDTGYLYIDGTPYKYTAIEKVFSGGPPVVVQLDVEKKSSTSELIGLTDANKLLFYNCSFGSPSSTHTVSMTHNSTTIKTIDPKYLPSGSGGGGAFLVNATLTPDNNDGTTGTAVFDKTFAETLAAVQAGQYVSCQCVPPGLDGSTVVLPAYSYNGDGVAFMISAAGMAVLVSMMPSEGSYELAIST